MNINLGKRKTVFLDIDGCLLKHQETYENMISKDPEILPDVLDFLEKLRQEDAVIVLTTARMEQHRAITQHQLARVGIFYDKLIMDMGAGERWLVNDNKPDMEVTARAFVVERNSGLGTLLNA